MRHLKRLSLVLLLIFVSFTAYVIIINRNSVHMTTRQMVLRAVYPVWNWWANLTGKNSTILRNKDVLPPLSFYSMGLINNDGTPFDISTLKGKKVMLVNTASDCGYTAQYISLQNLQNRNKDRLVIIGFPANDFKNQEKGDDSSIAEFCKRNFDISFPLMQKSSVIAGPQQNPVFQWLTDPAKNGWNSKQPSWNFCKYLVNEKGVLTCYFGSSISPAGNEIKNAMDK